MLDVLDQQDNLVLHFRHCVLNHGLNVRVFYNLGFFHESFYNLMLANFMNCSFLHTYNGIITFAGFQKISLAVI